MHLGFVFNMMDADLELAMHKNPSFFEDEDAEHMMDDSSALEALADEFKAEYLSLNWDYCAFVIWEEQLDKLFAKAQKLEAKAKKDAQDKDRKQTYAEVAKEKAKWGL
jgi:hypothetical protein